jgi:UDP-3-O-[3-hydroxymyristoyl] glucosamine N-acyltransferase
MSFRFTAGQVQGLFGGELLGDPETVIERFSPIEEAGPGSVTFIWNKKYYSALKTTKASLVLVPKDIERSWAPPGVAILVHDNPYLVLAKGMQLVFQQPRPSVGVSPQGHVAPTAKLGARVNVHPFAYVGENAELGDDVDVMPFAYVGARCTVGEGTVLHPGAVLYPKTRVGARCIVHSGAVVGSDGFGFATDKEKGEHVKIPQTGIAVLEDDVEVGASTTIDRAVFGETRIGAGTKIDNLVQIAHNVRVGRGCFLVAQSGIAGTTRVGDFVTIAAQAGLVGHIEVGSNSIVGAQSGVTESWPDGSQIVGTPAIEGKRAMRYHLTFPYLPDMRTTLRKLVARVEELEARLGIEGDAKKGADER